MIHHLQYLKYVIRHKWYVLQECHRLGITWQGIVHDLGKFRLDEWVPYAERFYGTFMSLEEYRALSPGIKQFYFPKLKEQVRMEFDVAWLKHQHRNPHHWQFWVLREDSGATKVLAMPYRYILEMVADWRGAGRAQGKLGTAEWYAKNKDHILLDDITRQYVELLLNQGAQP